MKNYRGFSSRKRSYSSAIFLLLILPMLPAVVAGQSEVDKHLKKGPATADLSRDAVTVSAEPVIPATRRFEGPAVGDEIDDLVVPKTFSSGDSVSNNDDTLPNGSPKTGPFSNLEDKDENDTSTIEEPWRPFDNLDRHRSFTERSAPDDGPDPDTAPPLSDKFHWKKAIYQSLAIQGFQHAYALIIQEKTRRSLKGPFFEDYWKSLKGLRGWSDGNRFFTNYIAHPMQGGMTGFIFVQNHDRAKRQKFGESKQYWKDRARALVWSTAWSTNWELGPISQSSIGNVGLYGHQGYVDLVVTPTVGTAWLITEEAIDRYLIRHIESKNGFVRVVSRSFLNPMRSVANLLRFRSPWFRDRPAGH